jgi:hypothetical protein
MGRNTITVQIIALLLFVSNSYAQGTGINLKPFCPTPGNQGHNNSCSAYSIAFAWSIAENAVKNRTNRKEQDSNRMSASFLYNLLQPKDIGTQSVIIPIEQLFKVSLKIGGLTVTEFPETSRFELRPTEGQIREAAQQKASQAIRIWEKRQNKSIVPILEAALLDSMPAIVQVEYWESMEAIEKSEQPWKSKRRDRFLGTHSMVLVSFDTDKQLFTLLNSRGKNWCDGGYITLGYHELSRIILSAYVLVPFTRTTNNWKNDYAIIDTFGLNLPEMAHRNSVISMGIDSVSIIATLGTTTSVSTWEGELFLAGVYDNNHRSQTQIWIKSMPGSIVQTFGVQSGISEALLAASDTSLAILAQGKKGNCLAEFHLLNAYSGQLRRSRLIIGSLGAIYHQFSFIADLKQYVALGMQDNSIVISQFNLSGDLQEWTHLCDSLFSGMILQDLSMIANDSQIVVYGSVKRMADPAPVINPFLLKLRWDGARWLPEADGKMIWMDISIHNTGQIAKIDDDRWALVGTKLDEFGQKRGYLWLIDPQGIIPSDHLLINMAQLHNPSSFNAVFDIGNEQCLIAGEQSVYADNSHLECAFFICNLNNSTDTTSISLGSKKQIGVWKNPSGTKAKANLFRSKYSTKNLIANWIDISIEK